MSATNPQSDCFLLIDVNFLANRAMHTTGNFRHPENPDQYIGVLHGLMTTCIKLEKIFKTFRLAFFFDSKDISKRRAIYPEYKQNRVKAREKDDDDMKRLRANSRTQVIQFYNLLRLAGCANVWGIPGYEADDLIASVCHHDAFHKLIIISSDSDLYQLLEKGQISMYNPITDRFYTEDKLFEDYGLPPADWPYVKAIAGDSSDNIKGIQGIGEKRAVKYMTGGYPEKHPTAKKIEEHNDIINRNMDLVTLPFTGCPMIKLLPQFRGIDWGVIASHIGDTSWDISLIKNQT